MLFRSDVGGAIKNDHIDVFIGTASISPFSFVTSNENDKFIAFKINSSLIKSELEKDHL